MPRVLGPNASAAELRYEFARTTPADRLRAGEALSRTAITLAGRARRSSPRHAPPRFFELLRKLCEKGVEFLITGGFAVIVHGYVRATKDLDIVPDPSPANLERLREVLVELEAHQTEGQDETWHTPLGDLLPHADVTPFAELRGSAVRLDLEDIGYPVWFAGVEHLIAMKQRANRDLDRIDVTALRMIGEV